MRSVTFLVFFIAMARVATAQTDYGKAGQLIDAEHRFAAAVKEKGIRKAFLAVSDENTILFRPKAVKAVEFFKKEKDAPGVLSWEPMLTRIAKSGDWGFTSGPYTFKQSDTSSGTGYGDYLSVWKRDGKNWKLAIDIGVSHRQPSVKPEFMIDNPLNGEYKRQIGSARIQQREDVVFSSDQLYGTMLKANQAVARKEFLSDNTRLLFPGNEAIIGKDAVNLFWARQTAKILSQPAKADRSISGELAFTYGDISLEIKGQVKKYSYLRIWELTTGFRWNVVMEVVSPV